MTGPLAPTTMVQASNAWRGLALLNGVVWFSCLGLGAVLLKLVFQFPFNMPYVDDWALTEWAVPDLPRPWASWWMLPVTGHQSIILKLINRALGAWLSWDLFYVSVMSTVTMIGAALLVLSNFRQILHAPSEGRVAGVLAFAALALVLLTPRQMQNLAQNICLPWPLALACMGGFAYLLHADRRNPTNWRLLALALLTVAAPMTIGFGLVLPFYIAVLVPFELLRRAEPQQPLRLDHVAVLAASAVVSVAVSYVLPSYFLGGGSGVPTSSALARILTDPLDAAVFVLAYPGQVFVVPEPSKVPAASVWGGALLGGFAVAFMARLRAEGPSQVVALVRTHSLLVMSLGFLVIMLLTRGVPFGSAISMEMRYSTLAALLDVCILVYLIDTAAAFRLSNRSMLIASTLLLAVGVHAWQVGHFTGFSWIEARSVHARGVVQCLRDQQPRIDLTVTNPCIAQVYPPDMFGRANFERWLQLLHQHRLTFFVYL